MRSGIAGCRRKGHGVVLGVEAGGAGVGAPPADARDCQRIAVRIAVIGEQRRGRDIERGILGRGETAVGDRTGGLSVAGFTVRETDALAVPPRPSEIA